MIPKPPLKVAMKGYNKLLFPGLNGAKKNLVLKIFGSLCNAAKSVFKTLLGGQTIIALSEVLSSGMIKTWIFEFFFNFSISSWNFPV